MIQDPQSWVNPGIQAGRPSQRDPVDPRLHRLQWNENPFDFPQDLKEEVISRLTQLEWSRYPLDVRPWALIDRIAAHCAVGPDQVVAGDGSSHVIMSVMQSVLCPGATVVMPTPTFLLYRQNARLLAAQCVEIPLPREDDFALPVAALVEASWAHKAPLVVICAPNNPTGTVYAADAIRRLAEDCHGLLLVDEAYAEFCGQNLTELLALGNVVLLRTFSKLFAMAGVRVGYALTSPTLAAQFQKAIHSFPLSVFSEITAEVALDNYARFLDLRNRIVAERERMRVALAGMCGVHVFPSGTNFLLVQLDHPRPALLEHLLHQHNLLISDNAAYPELADCVRISVGAPAQNDRLIQGFQEHIQ
jgi:histidinol-phosphate aminotransferase